MCAWVVPYAAGYVDHFLEVHEQGSPSLQGRGTQQAAAPQAEWLSGVVPAAGPLWIYGGAQPLRTPLYCSLAGIVR